MTIALMRAHLARSPAAAIVRLHLLLTFSTALPQRTPVCGMDVAPVCRTTIHIRDFGRLE